MSSDKLKSTFSHALSDFGKSQTNMAACCLRHQKSLTSKLIESMGRQTQQG